MIINEIGKAIIEFPMMGFTGEKLAIVNEESHGFSIVAPYGDERNIPTSQFIAGYISSTRALKTVTGELIVDGKRILPENYVAQWREVPITPYNEIPTLGFDLFGYLQIDIEAESSKKWFVPEGRPSAASSFLEFKERFAANFMETGLCKFNLKIEIEALAFSQFLNQRHYDSKSKGYPSNGYVQLIELQGSMMQSASLNTSFHNAIEKEQYELSY